MSLNCRHFLLLSTLFVVSCSQNQSEWSSATTIERMDQTIGGEKALATIGDIILENDQLRVAILTTRNSMGPGLFGGSIIDADLQYTDPTYLGGHGRDQLAELFPTVNLNVAMPIEVDDVKIEAAGGDSAAVVSVTSHAQPFLTLLNTLWAVVGSPEMQIYTEYSLEPGERWVRIKSVATVGEVQSDDPIEGATSIDYYTSQMPVLDIVLEEPIGLAMGDFYLSGGSVDVFAPDMGFDEDGAVFEASVAGENIFTNPFEFDFLASVGDGISYGIAPAEGSVFVPMFTASQTIAIGGGVEVGDALNDGDAYVYDRYFFVGNGDVGSIVDSYVIARDIKHGFVEGVVLEEGTGAPLSGVDVLVFKPGAEAPWSQWETDVALSDDYLDGSFGGALPVGQWELLVHQHGRPDGDRVPIVVAEGDTQQLAIAGRMSGQFTFTIRDEVGRSVPAKVTVFSLEEESSRNPVYGDGFIAGSPEFVVFPMYGEGVIQISPGNYYAVASRGLEYEIHQSAPFTIDESRSHHIDFELIRSVDTQGWVSADLHVHAAPSHDSGVALADRVRTMVCEGVEFFSSTDHDYITDYAPTVELLGMEEWVQTAVGVEVTTLEVGHFLGFPLKEDFTVEAGGAMDWTNTTPQEIIDMLREESPGDPVVFVGHPRDGLLGYFDQYGFDPYSGSVYNPTLDRPLLSWANELLGEESFSWDFDAIEILNGKRFELLRTPLQTELDDYAEGLDVDAYSMLHRSMDEQIALIDGDPLAGGIEGQIDDWFSLLNLGYHYTALGNSDTHGWTSTEAGCPRNYIMANTDNPAFLDDQDIADAVREHRVVASYGPFLQMWVDGNGIGSEIVANGSTVTVEVEVQAPSWMAVDRVELYANGELIKEWEITADNEIVRCSEKLEVTLDGDTWFVAVTMGEGDLAPVFTPVEIPYVDLQMVVEEALVGVEMVSSMMEPSAPLPTVHPIYPFAITNPVWVDSAGDGYYPPGLPDWLSPPPEK